MAFIAIQLEAMEQMVMVLPGVALQEEGPMARILLQGQTAEVQMEILAL